MDNWEIEMEGKDRGVDPYAQGTIGDYLVLATEFHGGGILSRHRSLAAAMHAVAKHQSAACTCGCAGVVSRAHYESLCKPKGPDYIEVSNPYRLRP